MKNKFLTLAASIVTLSVVAPFAAKPAFAVVRAALTQNVDEKGRNPYFQQESCSAIANSCNARFAAVPSGYRLVVEHLNMFVTSSTALDQVAIFGHGTIAENAHLTQQANDSSGFMAFSENEPFLAYYEAGESPEVIFDAQSGATKFISAQVTLVGYLVNLNE